jgi:hypothetical protein
MPDVQFRKENEIKTQYSTRILQDEWISYENEIRRLHGDRKTKVEILKALESESFYPSMPQLSKQMRKWGLKVYGQRKGASADLQKKDGLASDTDTLIPLSTISSNVEIHEEIETEVIDHVQDDPPAGFQGTCFSEAGHHCQVTTQMIEDPSAPTTVDNIWMLDASSETSSMRKFHALAVRSKKPANASSHSLPTGADTMSICSGDSWSFHCVTGMPVNSSTERLKTHDSTCSSDLRGKTLIAPDSEEDLRKLQMSPLLPLRQSSQRGVATMKLSPPPRTVRKRVTTDTSLPPIACWWPLSPPKYEDEIRFSTAYKLLSIFKLSLSIVTAFETNKPDVLGPTQAFHDFHDSLLLGIGYLNEDLFSLLNNDYEWTEDSK